LWGLDQRGLRTGLDESGGMAFVVALDGENADLRGVAWGQGFSWVRIKDGDDGPPIEIASRVSAIQKALHHCRLALELPDLGLGERTDGRDN
jgi:hypothetical protein